MKIRIEGPYYGSYSLAIVNKMLAIHLAKERNHEIFISATSAENWQRDLDQEQKMDDLYNIKYLDSRSLFQPDVVIRNTWPINHECLDDNAFKLRYFFWEELLVPDYIINGFNDNYHAILAPSEFVKRALLGSGLKLPILLLPNGVDEIYQFNSPHVSDKCNFFHNSSCFPRKSPDTLVRAFIHEFSESDNVSLTIKSFWNPHNNVKNIIEEEKHYKPDSPSISYIENDLSEIELMSLYTKSHFFVFPSKGEGYGLPPEESHAVGRPVIMPKSSALRERFIENIDISINFDAQIAKTHLSSMYSIWFDPDFYSLRLALRMAYNEWENDISSYHSRVQELKKYEVNRWERTAVILHNILINYNQITLAKESNRCICIISTFAQKCGIADYTLSLLREYTGNLEHSEFFIFAPFIPETDSQPINFEELPNLKITIVRCWDYWGDVVLSLLHYVKKHNFTEVYIQHHTGFYSVNQLSGLIDLFHSTKVKIKVTLHSLFQDGLDHSHGIYSDLVKEKGSSRCLFYVHSLREYRNGGCADFLFLLPQGISSGNYYSELRPSFDGPFGNSYLVSSFGFLRRHKGIRELIYSWAYVALALPDARLILLTAQHPAPDSLEEVKYCRELISTLKLEESISLITDHLDSDVIEGVISYADCVVFPYKEVNEGSSAAIRQAISAASAIICSKISLFDEFSDSILRIDMTDPASLADMIIKVITDRSLREDLRSKAKQLRSILGWDKVASVYWF